MKLSDMPIVQPAVAPHGRDVACLTSMRFFAAAWVLALHYAQNMPIDLRPTTMFFENGGMGVDFFFILSGFILTHVYVGSVEAGTFGFKGFIRKRLARIYPLHLVCFFLVLGYVAAGWLMNVAFQDPEVYSWRALWPNLLLLHAWGTLDGMSWNYVSWSISAEWFAYLLFMPASLLLAGRRLSSATKLALAFAFFLALYIVAPTLFGRELTRLTHDFGVMRILPEFVIGIALYHASRDWDVDGRTGPLLLALAVAGIVLVGHFDLGGLLVVPLQATIIFTAASLERQGKIGFLKNRVLVYLGETSYSLYMTHAIVFIVYFKALRLLLGDAFASWIWYLGPVAVAGAFVAASLGYHLVEIPARQWLAGRGKARVASRRALDSRTGPARLQPESS